MEKRGIAKNQGAFEKGISGQLRLSSLKHIEFMDMNIDIPGFKYQILSNDCQTSQKHFSELDKNYTCWQIGTKTIIFVMLFGSDVQKSLFFAWFFAIRNWPENLYDPCWAKYDPMDALGSLGPMGTLGAMGPLDQKRPNWVP